MFASNAPRAPLEMFPYSADAGHAGENHNGQTDKTDQAIIVENLLHPAKPPPFDHLSHLSFPKYLKLLTALRASLLINPYHRNSQHPPRP